MAVCFSANAAVSQRFDANSMSSSKHRAIQKHVKKYKSYKFDRTAFLKNLKEDSRIKLNLAGDYAFDMTLAENNLCAGDCVVECTGKNGTSRMKMQSRIYKGKTSKGDDVRLSVFSDKVSMVIIDGNGKQTYVKQAKELTNAVMSTTYNVLCTQGNLNNSIGVPLTVMGLKPEHEYAIIEMGASHPGDIKELVEVSQPDFGLITNVGKAHLLGFGSFEGVKRTKGELYDWLREHNGIAFVNRDNEHLQQMCKGLPLVEYGKPGQEGLLVEGEVLECNPFVKFRWRRGGGDWHMVQTNLIGAYNVDNALAAITIGLKFGVKEQDASDAVANYMPQNNRSQLTETGRNHLVVDAYNANPTSMAAALENFSMIKAQDKMLILGDMRELGDVSQDEHRRIVEEIHKYGFTQVWLVGSEFAGAAGDSGFRLFPDVEAVNSALQSEPVNGKTILIKGSNSI